MPHRRGGALSLLKIKTCLNKAVRFGYYTVNDPGLYELQNNIERKLFQNITSNPAHALHELLPTVRLNEHNLRPRGHKFNLPTKDDTIFITIYLYTFI